jgi:hypothetical protein
MSVSLTTRVAHRVKNEKVNGYRQLSCQHVLFSMENHISCLITDGYNYILLDSLFVWQLASPLYMKELLNVVDTVFISGKYCGFSEI